MAYFDNMYFCRIFHNISQNEYEPITMVIAPDIQIYGASDTQIKWSIVQRQFCDTDPGPAQK